MCDQSLTLTKEWRRLAIFYFVKSLKTLASAAEIFGRSGYPNYDIFGNNMVTLNKTLSHSISAQGSFTAESEVVTPAPQ